MKTYTQADVVALLERIEKEVIEVDHLTFPDNGGKTFRGDGVPYSDIAAQNKLRAYQRQKLSAIKQEVSE